MEENTNMPVDAGQENVTDSQISHEPQENVQAGSVPQSDPASQRPVQSAEVNAQFARVRREAEQRAKDAVIAEMGMEWNGKPITTYAEYQQALREQQEYSQRQQLQSQGINPDILNQVIENHPVVRQAKEYLTKEQKQAQLRQEANEFTSMFPNVQFDTIPKEAWQLRRDRGLSILDAYLRVTYPSIQANAEQSAIQKLQTNAQTSPGALGNGADNQITSIKNMSAADFKKLQERVMREGRVDI